MPIYNENPYGVAILNAADQCRNYFTRHPSARDFPQYLETYLDEILSFLALRIKPEEIEIHVSRADKLVDEFEVVVFEKYTTDNKIILIEFLEKKVYPFLGELHDLCQTFQGL